MSNSNYIIAEHSGGKLRVVQVELASGTVYRVEKKEIMFLFHGVEIWVATHKFKAKDDALRAFAQLI